jgi:preprotein translocase subunit SecA
MATNKAKRSIHLAQPQPQTPQPNHKPAAPVPVRPHVYYTIAEFNSALEKAIQSLHTLQSNNLFGTADLAEMNRVLRGIHRRANHQLITALNARETANAGSQQLAPDPETR